VPIDLFRENRTSIRRVLAVIALIVCTAIGIDIFGPTALIVVAGFLVGVALRPAYRRLRP
jgi:predicted PurR-regulated permease PerM